MDNILFDPKFHRLSDFLGVDKYNRDDPQVSQKIAFLSDWAEKKSGSGEFTDILKTIIRLKKDLGTTLRGETLIKELYKWVRLDNDSDRLKSEAELQRQRMSEDEKKKAALEERILNRSKEWHGKKQELAKQKEITDAKNQEKVESYRKDQQKTSKSQKEANIKVKEETQEYTSEEIKL